jgi:hypothetical protein
MLGGSSPEVLDGLGERATGVTFAGLDLERT